MIIPPEVLEKTCKEMIKTVLLCLANANRGTIYVVGPMPGLQTIRITSGFRRERTDGIRWGLQEVSDYDSPGKCWDRYRDRPGGVLEAMAWCVEKQKSWTAEDPREDPRSVRKQLVGETEDFHHMEPVLIRKTHLYGEELHKLEYPVDWYGNPIWKSSEYVVVAVIKIHFMPQTIRRGDRSTKIIKKLSHTLGTEMLSLHLREASVADQKSLIRERLGACNVLAHELRNALVKLGFVFSAINAEISYLREQWELQLENVFPEIESKKNLIGRLNQLLELMISSLNGDKRLVQLGTSLLAEQQELANMALLPQYGKKWLDDKIRPKWRSLLRESPTGSERREEVEALIGRLEKRIWIGLDRGLAGRMSHLPEELRSKWPKLAYTSFTAERAAQLREILNLLDHPALDMPHKHQSKRIISSLQVLVEMIPDVEQRINRTIYALQNGSPVCSPESASPEKGKRACFFESDLMGC